MRSVYQLMKFSGFVTSCTFIFAEHVQKSVVFSGKKSDVNCDCDDAPSSSESGVTLLSHKFYIF